MINVFNKVHIDGCKLVFVCQMIIEIKALTRMFVTVGCLLFEYCSASRGLLLDNTVLIMFDNTL